MLVLERDEIVNWSCNQKIGVFSRLVENWDFDLRLIVTRATELKSGRPFDFGGRAFRATSIREEREINTAWFSVRVGAAPLAEATEAWWNNVEAWFKAPSTIKPKPLRPILTRERAEDLANEQLRQYVAGLLDVSGTLEGYWYYDEPVPFKEPKFKKPRKRTDRLIELPPDDDEK